MQLYEYENQTLQALVAASRLYAIWYIKTLSIMVGAVAAITCVDVHRNVSCDSLSDCEAKKYVTTNFNVSLRSRICPSLDHLK